jgi:hypothetical protein
MIEFLLGIILGTTITFYYMGVHYERHKNRDKETL